MSEIRVNTFKAEDGISAPSFPNGIQVTGIVTSTVLDNTVPGDLTVTGNVSVGGTLTYEDVKNVDSIGIITARSGVDVDDFISVGSNIHLGNAGVVTATSFVGNGSGLTGITQTTINNNANNRIITGSGTANTLEAESGLTYDGTTLQIAATDDIRIAGGTWTGEYTGGIKIQADPTNSYFQFKNNLYFRNTAGQNKIVLDQNGMLTPSVNNAQDLGSTSYRWRVIYTNDLELSNKGSQNSVDGTWGDWTLQEGENDIFMINNRSGKKFKINLTEV